MKYKLVSFAGQHDFGKTECANYLISKMNNWKKESFANPVKDIFCKAFNKDRAWIEEWKRKKENPPDMDKTCREALQFIGDGFRQIKHSVWEDMLLNNLSQPTIVDDCRYITEAEAVKDKGGLSVLLYRPNFLNDDPNKSESEIGEIIVHILGMYGNKTEKAEGEMNTDLYDFFIINDGTIDDLYRKIDKYILPLMMTPIDQERERLRE